MKFNLIVIALSLSLAGLALAQYQPHAIWSREGAGDSSLYGEAILALGDQNNDGYNDWAVFALGTANDTYHGSQLAYLEFFHGGNPPDTAPYIVRTVDSPSEASLWGAQALGDLNGDGYVDWAVVAQRNDGSFDNDYKLYFGGPGPHDTPDIILSPPWYSGYIGIGDFNGDGYDDLMLADGTNNYSAILYGGNPLDTIPDWTHYPILWPKAYGNLNGDRYSDFISDTGPVVGPQFFYGGVVPDTVPAYSFPGLHYQYPTIVNDLNGDGFDDIACARREGSKLLWGGTILDTLPDAFLDFPCYNSIPTSILSAGDFNHDGRGDVVMLSSYCSDEYWGVLTLHLGSRWMLSAPTFVIYGWTAPFNLIHFRTAVSLGDINGDHVDDLAIGANQDGPEHAAWRGKAVVLTGDTGLVADADEPLVPLPSSLGLAAYPNPFNSTTTIEIELPAFHDRVDLALYDILGRRVLNESLHPQSSHVAYRLNAANLPSGLYLLNASTGSQNRTAKLMLMK